jgi:hypothetical protein
MTLHTSLTWTRWTLASGLVGAWIYAFMAWHNYPKGASTTMCCLLGFVALGLAPWIAPSLQWSRFLRVVGSIIAFIAFALAFLLSGLLRNGL